MAGCRRSGRAGPHAFHPPGVSPAPCLEHVCVSAMDQSGRLGLRAELTSESSSPRKRLVKNDSMGWGAPRSSPSSAILRAGGPVGLENAHWPQTRAQSEAHGVTSACQRGQGLRTPSMDPGGVGQRATRPNACSSVTSWEERAETGFSLRPPAAPGVPVLPPSPHVGDTAGRQLELLSCLGFVKYGGSGAPSAQGRAPGAGSGLPVCCPPQRKPHDDITFLLPQKSAHQDEGSHPGAALSSQGPPALDPEP